MKTFIFLRPLYVKSMQSMIICLLNYCTFENVTSSCNFLLQHHVKVEMLHDIVIFFIATQTSGFLECKMIQNDVFFIGRIMLHFYLWREDPILLAIYMIYICFVHVDGT